MGKIISIASLKGGTGKTIISINLCLFFSALGKKVLLVDASYNGDASFCLGIKKSPNSIKEILQGKTDLKFAIKNTQYFNYDIIPCFSDLEKVFLKKKTILKKAFQTIKKDYDFIIIDTSPIFDILMLNALYSSDFVIIPTQCEYLSLRTVNQFIFKINSLKILFSKKPKILLTMYGQRSLISRKISKMARKQFLGKVFNTSIPRTVVLSKEKLKRELILKSFPKSRAAKAFRQLAEEIINY